MDTIQKAVLGIAIGAGIAAAALMMSSLVHSGVWLSKGAQEDEINNLSSVADEFVLYANTKKYSARAMFIEHCESRLATWERLHGIKPWSDTWTKFHNRYHELLKEKFQQE